MNELAARLRAVPEGDLSIAVGAVALTSAAAVAFDRMQGPWAAFPLFLLLAIPAAVLLALGLAFAVGGGQIGTGADGRLAPWQTACLLTGIPLLVASVIQLLVVFGNDDPGTGTATFIFALAGIGTLILRLRCESPGLTLLAGLFFGVGFLTATDWADSSAQVATYRDVLLIEGILFLLAARQTWDLRRADANVLVGLSGVSFISGAVLGNIGNPAALFFSEGEVHSGDGWELVLIVVSIGLLAYAAWQRNVGIGFIGVVGAFIFFGFADTDGDLAGWPILLALAAAGCIYWSLVLKPRQSGGSVPPTSQAPPASGQPPASPEPSPPADSPPPPST